MAALRLAAAGKRVFLALQAPMLEKDIKHYIRAARFVSGVGRQLSRRNMAAICNRLMDMPENVVLVDPTDLSCSGKAYASVLDGEALDYDDDHMSPSGASRGAEEIIRRASSLGGTLAAVSVRAIVDRIIWRAAEHDAAIPDPDRAVIEARAKRLLRGVCLCSTTSTFAARRFWRWPARRGG